MAHSGPVKRVLAAGVALLGFYLAVLLLAWPMMLLVPRQWTRGVLGLGATSVPTVIAALIVSALLVRQGTSRWETLGWRGVRHGLSWFGKGAALGLGMAMAALMLAVWGGTARIVVSGGAVVGYAVAALRVGAVLLVAALAEELLFRGYPLARLAKAIGRVGASIVLGLVFVLLHAGNPNVTRLGLTNIGLASLVLSAAFFTPGGLPLAWGLHFGWNGGLGLGADAPVSGLSFDLPVLDFVTGGPSWFTGGAFGPEGGLVATVVMSLTLRLLWRRIRKGESQQDEPT